MASTRSMFRKPSRRNRGLMGNGEAEASPFFVGSSQSSVQKPKARSECSFRALSWTTDLRRAGTPPRLRFDGCAEASRT